MGVVERVADGYHRQSQIQHVEHDKGQDHPFDVPVDADQQDRAEQGGDDRHSESHHEQGAGALDHRLGILQRGQLAQVRHELVVDGVHQEQPDDKRHRREGAADLKHSRRTSHAGTSRWHGSLEGVGGLETNEAYHSKADALLISEMLFFWKFAYALIWKCLFYKIRPLFRLACATGYDTGGIRANGTLNAS